MGKITHMNINFGHGGPYVPYVMGATGLPHFIDPVLSGGGCLQDLAPHGISRGFWSVGPGAKANWCETKILERRKNPRVMSGKPFESPVDDWAEATLEIYDPRTNSTFPMEVKTSWCGGFPFPCEIEGEVGNLVTTKSKRGAYEPTIFPEDDEQEPVSFPLNEDPFEPFRGHIREIQLFAQAILEGRPSPTNAEYALRLEEILSLHYFSKLKGGRVTLEEMDAWGAEMEAQHGGGQATVEAIAKTFAGTVALL
jgi:predicted dehydrogenase